MLSDDVKMIDFSISESLHTVGEVDAWQRIKTALAELDTTPNTGSPKLLLLDELDSILSTGYEALGKLNRLKEISQQLRASA